MSKPLRFSMRSTNLESKALFGDAKAKAGAFFKGASRYIRELFVAGVLAVAGPSPLTAAEMQALDAEVATQDAYLKTFERELVEGNKPLDGTFVSRAEQYGSERVGSGPGDIASRGDCRPVVRARTPHPPGGRPALPDLHRRSREGLEDDWNASADRGFALPMPVSLRVCLCDRSGVSGYQVLRLRSQEVHAVP